MIISYTNGCISYKMSSFRSIVVGSFRLIMGSFCIIMGSFHIIMRAFCITSACHIIISVFNIPLGQFYIIACANYTIISGKRNIMGRRVPRHTCLRVAKLNRDQSI